MPVKRLDNLIKSLDLLPKRIKQSIIVKIVGSGKDMPALKKLVKRLNLTNIVIFEGFKTNVSEYYKNSDLFMLISDREGFPMSLLEAMSFGLPCITNNFGLPISKDSAYILNNNNPPTLAKSIETLYTNPSLRKKLSKNAFAKVKTNFSFDNVTKKHIQIYESMKR